MSRSTQAASGWEVLTHPTGEVLAAAVHLPGLYLGLLGVPRGFAPREVERWLEDVGGVARQSGTAESPSRAIPSLLHQALSGLLFSHAELWDRAGGAATCSFALTEADDVVGFGWIGEARVAVWVDGEPEEPRAVIIRDTNGREAHAWSLPAGRQIELRVAWSRDLAGPGAGGAEVEATWGIARATPAASDSHAGPGLAPPAVAWGAEESGIDLIRLEQIQVPETHEEIRIDQGQVGIIGPEYHPIPDEDPHGGPGKDAAASPATGPGNASYVPSGADGQSEALAAGNAARRGWWGRLMEWLTGSGRKRRTAAAVDEGPANDPGLEPPAEHALSPVDPPSSSSPEPVPATVAPEPALVMTDLIPPTPEPESLTLGAQGGMPAPAVWRDATVRIPSTPEPREVTERAASWGHEEDPHAIELPPAEPVAAPAVQPARAETVVPVRAEAVAPAGEEPVAHGEIVLDAPPDATAQPGAAPAEGVREGPPGTLSSLDMAVLEARPVEPRDASGSGLAFEFASPTEAEEPAEDEESASGEVLAAGVSPAPVETRVPPAPPSDLQLPAGIPIDVSIFDPGPRPSRRDPHGPQRPAWPSAQELAPRPHPLEVLKRIPWWWYAAIAVLFAGGWMVGSAQDNGRPRDAADRGVFLNTLRMVGLGGPRFVVDVSSRPPGAWISVDGQPLTLRTPARVEMTPGEHTVGLAFSEFGGETYPVRGRKGERVPLIANLWGALEVFAPGDVGTVEVTVDGLPRGVAPMRVDSLAPGVHEVRFSGPNVATWGQTVDIRVGETHELVARAVQSPAYGVLHVDGTMTDEQGTQPLKGGQVWVDGEPRGTTPLTLDLPRGPHSVRLVYRGQEAPIQVIDLPGGNQRFAVFEIGLDQDVPRLVVDAPARVPRDRPVVISATLSGVSAGEVRTMWLHARMAEGQWRRYAMTVLKATAGAVGVAPFPVGAFDGQGRARYYISAQYGQGDESFTELRTITLEAPAKR